MGPSAPSDSGARSQTAAPPRRETVSQKTPGSLIPSVSLTAGKGPHPGSKPSPLHRRKAMPSDLRSLRSPLTWPKLLTWPKPLTWPQPTAPPPTRYRLRLPPPSPAQLSADWSVPLFVTPPHGQSKSASSADERKQETQKSRAAILEGGTTDEPRSTKPFSQHTLLSVFTSKRFCFRIPRRLPY